MKFCPSCDRTLREDAKSCPCGWGAEAVAKGSKLLENALDRRCKWTDAGCRCAYPVKFFEPGSTKGLCRYHLKAYKDKMTPEDYAMCERINRFSQTDTDEAYQLRSNFETYGEGRSQYEQELFDKMKNKTTKVYHAATKTSASYWDYKEHE